MDVCSRPALVEATPGENLSDLRRHPLQTKVKQSKGLKSFSVTAKGWMDLYPIKLKQHLSESATKATCKFKTEYLFQEAGPQGQLSGPQGVYILQCSPLTPGHGSKLAEGVAPSVDTLCSHQDVTVNRKKEGHVLFL